jgi:Abortive infection alpha
MGDELLPAVKAAEQLEPAVQAFAEATGILGPVREFAMWATDLIRYRRAPHQAKLLMGAAEKVRASGLPPSAVSDKLLRAALEDGAMEDDPGMQERWANLLANAGTSATSVKTAFPEILRQLDPVDAVTLDEFAALAHGDMRVITIGAGAAERSVLDNLTRLGLLRYTRSTPTTITTIDDRHSQITGVMFTELGLDFLRACRPPQHRD